MITVTTPLGNTHPTLWMELATTRQATSQVIERAGTPVAIIHGARPRTRMSRLMLFYPDETEARAAEDLHTAGGICSITDPDRPTHNMHYIVSGAITRTLDAESARRWVLSIDVTEVPS